MRGPPLGWTSLSPKESLPSISLARTLLEHGHHPGRRGWRGDGPVGRVLVALAEVFLVAPDFRTRVSDRATHSAAGPLPQPVRNRGQSPSGPVSEPRSHRRGTQIDRTLLARLR